jgi:UDP-hydrolysing UDP-N-acetyl-D-glucosamine 2-epimerase
LLKRIREIATKDENQPPPTRKVIAVCTANRAEKGLLESVILELQSIPYTKIQIIEIRKEATYFNYILAWYLQLQKLKPDFAIIPCDRIEMLACANVAFALDIPFAHFHAGDLGAVIRDDSIRHSISRLSSIMLCETEESTNFLLQSGEEPWRIHLVGSTAFDNIQIPTREDFLEKYSLPPNYSILLYHPDPYNSESFNIEKIYVDYCKDNELLIIMHPNDDPGREVILREITRVCKPEAANFRELPSFFTRSDFLAAVKYCKRFIGNSSSMYFEAPYLGAETIHIGMRNKERKPIKVMTGGSRRIAEIISRLDLTPEGKLRLLRKKYVSITSISDELKEIYEKISTTSERR